MKIKPEELKKITYLDNNSIGDRAVLLMPLWDGEEWKQWLPINNGELAEIKPVDIVHSDYLAKDAVKETDLWIPFVDFIWQRGNWPEIYKINHAICEDFHNLATSIAKINYFFRNRESIGGKVSSFVETEIEYIVTLARSIFDLLQETIAKIWKNRISFLDPETEKMRKQRNLPETFSKIVLRNKQDIKTADELQNEYGLPTNLAAAYYSCAGFFNALRKVRDNIVHGSGSVSGVFDTEKGFCVSPNSKGFCDFDIWDESHKYNENISSLLPWLTHVVFNTINACSEIMSAFSQQIQFPEEMAPGYKVFIRGLNNEALISLIDVAKGEKVWW